MNYPSPDALQEFRLITNSYSAEYGQAVGSMFNAVTRSGTNEVHGSAFEFLRNDALNARNFFTPSVPLLRQNQFGGVVGGPLKRDRLFLFGSYQGTRVHQQTLLTGFPTTAQEINGFFAEPAGRVLKNPATGQPYPLSNPATNTYFVDPSTFNPIAVRVNNTWVPSVPSAGQYVTLAPTPQTNDQYLIKGDANVSSKNRATLSYFRDRTRFTNPAYGGSSFLNYSPTNSRVDVWSGSIADTHTFSPTLINEARLHYMRDYNYWDSPNKLTATDLGIQNFPLEIDPEPPTFSVSGRWSLVGGGNLTLAELGYRDQFTDSVTWVHGAHSVRFGGEVMRMHWGIRTYSAAPGIFSFTGTFTNDPLADFLLGLPAQVQRGAHVFKDAVTWSHAEYVQDDWKVNRRLTVNFGLRYEIEPPFALKGGRNTVFRYGQKSQLVPGLPEGMVVVGDPGVPASVVDTDLHKLGSRVGLAWDPAGNGKTSVRASSGIFYGRSSPDLSTQTGSNPPWAAGSTLFAPAGGFTNPYLGQPQPFPYIIDTQHPLLALPQALNSTEPDYVDPRIYSWTLSVQRQIRSSWMLETAYVGKASEKLNESLAGNPAIYVPGQSTAANVNNRRIYYPGILGAVQDAASSGHATYHGLDVTSRTRLQRGLTMIASYTWSKSIDADSGNAVPTRTNQDPFNRRAEKAPSDFDRRHVFTVSWAYNKPKLSTYLGNSKVVGVFTDGWEFSGLSRISSSAPYTVSLGYDNTLTGGGLDRPNVVGNLSVPGDRSRADQIAHWFNPAAFVAPPTGVFGNAGRNFAYGPGSANVDVGLFKSFTNPKGDRWGRLQFRAEIFNVLNQVNLWQPTTTLNAGANFGRITSAGSPRIVQFGLKYLF
jgi:hypothetical protein